MRRRDFTIGLFLATAARTARAQQLSIALVPNNCQSKISSIANNSNARRRATNTAHPACHRSPTKATSQPRQFAATIAVRVGD
jgi:hypothetical protein